MEQTLVESVITNVPNFVFSAIAVWILYKQNSRLMDIVEKRIKCCDEQVEAVSNYTLRANVVNRK